MSNDMAFALALDDETARHAAAVLAGPAPTARIAEIASRASQQITEQLDGDHSVGSALEMVESLVGTAVSILGRTRGADRLPSGLEDLVAELTRLSSQAAALREDIACLTCGDFNNDGEGEDGYCGNCADTHYDAEGRHLGPPAGH